MNFERRLRALALELKVHLTPAQRRRMAIYYANKSRGVDDCVLVSDLLISCEDFVQ
jgi:hypothetical protein